MLTQFHLIPPSQTRPLYSTANRSTSEVPLTLTPERRTVSNKVVDYGPVCDDLPHNPFLLDGSRYTTGINANMRRKIPDPTLTHTPYFHFSLSFSSFPTG